MPGDAKKPAQQKVEKRYKKTTIDSANSHNKFDPLPYLLFNWPSNEDNLVVPVVEEFYIHIVTARTGSRPPALFAGEKGNIIAPFPEKKTKAHLNLTILHINISTLAESRGLIFQNLNLISWL